MVVGNSGVDSGVGSGTSGSPGNDADQSLATAGSGCDERTAAVSLASVDVGAVAGSGGADFLRLIEVRSVALAALRSGDGLNRSGLEGARESAAGGGGAPAGDIGGDAFISSVGCRKTSGLRRRARTTGGSEKILVEFQNGDVILGDISVAIIARVLDELGGGEADAIFTVLILTANVDAHLVGSEAIGAVSSGDDGVVADDGTAADAARG